MGAHDAGNRVAVAEPEAGEPDMRRLQHQLLGMRGPAQEGEIRGDGEFEIVQRSLRRMQLTHTSRAGTSAASPLPCRGRGRRGTARSAARPCPRPGNSRAPGRLARSTKRPRCARGLRRAITSCNARRQRKRSGGPSGTMANTSSIGSGLASSRSGRGLEIASRRGNGATHPSRARLAPRPAPARLRRRARGYGCHAQ